MMQGNCSRPFFQVAWIVDDMTHAVQHWTAQGIGPFYLFPHAPLVEYRYRGQASTLDFSVALAQYGAIQLELIQQHDNRPSQYRDSYAPGQSGFHHMCRFTDDIAADIEMYRKQGYAMAADGISGDMRFAYIDTRQALGYMTEVVEDKPSIRGLFDTVARGAENWTGSDPIRFIV